MVDGGAASGADGWAVVTGAAGDIGQAIARRLARDHAGVILADRDGAAAARLAADWGPGFAGVAADVTDAGSVAALAARAADLGPVRTIVNNAGGVQAASLAASTPESWRADTSLNLDAAYLVVAAFTDQLKATQGSVVNIASVNGFGAYGHPAYSSAKAGLIHFTRMIAVEYGRYGIRANAVAPGTVRTRAWEARAVANPQVFADAARHYALGRIARAEDVAEAVGFLASPLAAAITGVCLPVDCGLTAGIPALAHTFSQSDDYRA